MDKGLKTLDILALNLRRLRDEKDLSQMDVAVAIGSSYGSVSRWETAKLMPKHENLDAIADFYGVSVSALFSEDLTTYKKADPNPTLEALSELVVEQKQKLKALELSEEEQRIIDKYRNTSDLRKEMFHKLADMDLDSNPDAQIETLLKPLDKTKQKSS